MKSLLKSLKIFNQSPQQKQKRNYLLRAEAINFDYIIEDTNQLSIRRGGSIAIHNALQSINNTFEGLTEIRCGGGIGIFKVETNDIKSLINNIKKHLSNDNNNMNITFISSLPFTLQYFELTTQDKQAEQQALRQLEAQSHRQQLQMPSFLFTNYLTETKSNTACELNGYLPASEEKIKGKKAAIFSYQRFKYGKKEKHNFINNLFDGNTRDKYVNDFKSLTSKVIIDNKRIRKLHNKLAILYFDGNSFGNYQKDFDLKEIKNFETTLQSVRKTFIGELVDMLKHEDLLHHHTTDQQQKEKQIRLELLLWGGDEIMLALPAWAGFSALHLFYETMVTELKTSHPDLSHAGGLVFCSHKTPIKRMIKLARELAEEAKNISRDENLYFPLVLESEDYPTQPILQHWEQHYGKPGQALLPVRYSGEQAIYEEYNKEETSKTALYKNIKHLIKNHSPDDCNHRELDKDIIEIKESIGNKNLDSEQLRKYFPLYDIPSTLTTHPDTTRQDKLKNYSPSQIKIQPWLYLIEYGDYLINLKKELENQSEKENKET